MHEFYGFFYLHVKLITFDNNASIEHEQLAHNAKVFLTGYD